MNKEQFNYTKLPLLAMKEIPTPNSEAKQIVALVKDKGYTTGYKLSDGSIVAKEEGVQLARRGGIQGVGISERNGREYLKSIPDETESNNLGNLPSITADSFS